MDATPKEGKNTLKHQGFQGRALNPNPSLNGLNTIFPPGCLLSPHCRRPPTKFLSSLGPVFKCSSSQTWLCHLLGRETGIHLSVSSKCPHLQLNECETSERPAHSLVLSLGEGLHLRVSNTGCRPSIRRSHTAR